MQTIGKGVARVVSIYLTSIVLILPSRYYLFYLNHAIHLRIDMTDHASNLVSKQRRLTMQGRPRGDTLNPLDGSVKPRLR